MRRFISLIAILLASFNVFAVISGTAVQCVSDDVSGGSNAQVTLSAATANNLLIAVAVRHTQSATYSISGWTESSSDVSGDGAYYVMTKQAAGGETTVGGTWSNTSQPNSLIVCEFDDTDLADVTVDVSNENISAVSTSSTSGDSSAASNTVADALVIGVIATDDPAAEITLSSITAGYTSQGDSWDGSARAGAAILTRVVSSTGSQQVTATISESVDNYGAIFILHGTAAGACSTWGSEVTITDTSDSADTENIINGQSPAIVANEDKICYDTVTNTNSWPVTVNADGTWQVDSNGADTTDIFDYCVSDNGAACGINGKFEITSTPTVTNVVGTQTGTTTADITAALSDTEGTAFYVVVTKTVHDSCGDPTHAQIAAGNDCNDAAATASGSDATPTTAQSFSATGLSESTTYRACVSKNNDATTPVTSTPDCSNEFTTDSSGDTTPETFTFIDVLDGVPDVEYTDCETITGIDSATPVDAGGCEYTVAGGSRVTNQTTVSNNDEVCVFVTAPTDSGDNVSCVVTIGGVQDTWTVTSGFVKSSCPLVRGLIQPLAK